MLWLNSLGIFRYVDQSITTLDSALPMFQNGVVLCDLVSVACGKKILGITRKPKVKATALSNISKAMELLRKRRDISNRFLWYDDAVIMHVFSLLLNRSFPIYQV